VLRSKRAENGEAGPAPSDASLSLSLALSLSHTHTHTHTLKYEAGPAASDVDWTANDFGIYKAVTATYKTATAIYKTVTAIYKTVTATYKTVTARQVRRTVLRSKRAENGEAGPAPSDLDWTANKYDGAMQQVRVC